MDTAKLETALHEKFPHLTIAINLVRFKGNSVFEIEIIKNGEYSNLSVYFYDDSPNEYTAICKEIEKWDLGQGEYVVEKRAGQVARIEKLGGGE